MVVEKRFHSIRPAKIFTQKGEYVETDSSTLKSCMSNGAYAKHSGTDFVAESDILMKEGNLFVHRSNI